jgi:NADH:ubiquinone oxidoreductase subunit 2 (subunit N)
MLSNTLPFVYPQLVLTAGILVVLLVGLRKTGVERRRGVILVAGLAFLVVAALVSILTSTHGGHGDLLQFDSFTKFFILLAVVACALSLIAASQSAEIDRKSVV